MELSDANKFWRKGLLVIVLALMLLFSACFYSLSLVSAVYTVGEHCMPSDSDDLEERCVMKTLRNGYFYIPNLDVKTLKIEFVYECGTADQCGGESPYPSLRAWPDGAVEGKDVAFIAHCYNTGEGDPLWNYTADINADRKIDGKDVAWVQKSYGSYGFSDYYFYDLAGVTVVFSTGQQATPDDGGYVMIPSGATYFNVYRNEASIGALITFGAGKPTLPIAYSTSFEFTVPNDGDEEVHYYVYAKIYVPSSLSGREFHLFPSWIDDWMLNVKTNNLLKYGGSVSDPPNQPPANVRLGILTHGYYLLEFEYVEKMLAGKLQFHVATATGEYAWLTRFRVYVPNYSDNTYRYTVKTRTYFPGDDFFLGGYVDDFIDDMYVDVGLLWDDWMWDMGEYGAIYSWGDGFMYPLGWQNGWHDITFTYGEIWMAGLLDFQYISWTNQRDKIGPPKFYASSNLKPYNQETHMPAFDEIIKIYSARFYGGSQWKDIEHPESSERNFETRLRLSAFWNKTWSIGIRSNVFDTRFEVGLGNGWAERILSEGDSDDVGITLNLTCLYFYTNTPSIDKPSEGDGLQWCLTLENIIVDIFSYPWLEIPSVEHYPNGESIVKTDYSVATEYIGSIIMAAAGILQPEIGLTGAAIGSLVGLGIHGIGVGVHYISGQQLEPYQETITELHHRQLRYNNHIDRYGEDAYGPLKIFAPDKNPKSSVNDLVFFKLDPVSSRRCGLTKVVLKGQIAALWYDVYYDYVTWDIPLCELEIAIYIPWFTS